MPLFAALTGQLSSDISTIPLLSSYDVDVSIVRRGEGEHSANGLENLSILSMAGQI
jgi:hypothetical protein